MLSCQVNPSGSLFFFSLQFKEAKVEPINMPPTPSPPSENEELSGEPVPEGTPETTNLSVVLHSSPEPGKSWVCLHDDDSGPRLDDVWNIEHLIYPSPQPFEKRIIIVEFDKQGGEIKSPSGGSLAGKQQSYLLILDT